MPPWDIRQIALCEAKGIPVPKDVRILDYGCGAGRRVYELLDAGYPYAAANRVRTLFTSVGNEADRVGPA